MPYSALWPMPRGAAPRTPWYWHLSGSTAWVHVSTEHAFGPSSPQGIWLADTLAHINRAVAPWLIILTHRPALVVTTASAAKLERCVDLALRYSDARCCHAVTSP